VCLGADSAGKEERAKKAVWGFERLDKRLGEGEPANLKIVQVRARGAEPGD